MKKTIMVSVLTILVLAGLVGVGTFAYFNDTETSTGNSFTAGTIDIAVDGGNPWVRSVPYTFTGVKPCDVKTIDFTITNVGTNPVVVWKHITVTSRSGGIAVYPDPTTGPASSEPEYLAEGGVGRLGVNDNLAQVINYDLKIGSSDIFLDSDDVTVEDIDCMWMPIGQILYPGGTVTVHQSYHIVATAGNEYQGDTITFTIDLYAEQRLGPGPTQAAADKLFLDNKSGETDWYFIADQTWGLLQWQADGSFSFVAQGLTVNTGYTLIYYPEPQTTWPWPVTAIASGNSDPGGELTWSCGAGSLPPVSNVKIWLVLSNDIVGGSLSGWQPTEYLFESNLVSIP
jgi:predicted ribosomally synthesized peptide with SipW-like signal peptide